MQVRYVDGSGVMPAGRQVVVCEGDGEVVIQLDMSAPPKVLLDALSRTVTAYARQRWIFVGRCAPMDREIA